MQRRRRKYSQKLIHTVIALLLTGSLWQLTTAGLIQGKAFFAQQLLNHAWNKTLGYPENINSKQNKPWPWADTWPVAKLIIPAHDINQIILAGDNGSSLAFAPGHSSLSAAPNSMGLTMISAHRDTHFNFLQDIKINDMIYLQSPETTSSYRVYDLQIVNSKNYRIEPDSDNKTILLVTCYPFETIMTGGSLRYLVFAEATSVSR